jgi:hypothetical protein
MIFKLSRALLWVGFGGLWVESLKFVVLFCVAQSVSDYSRFGGRASLVVDGLGSDLLMSHKGDDEGHLAVKPLNVILSYAANESKFPDWAINCAEWIHSRVGITYVGQKWQFMALLTFLEKDRLKEVQSLSASKKKREVKNLESSINYDIRGEGQSSRGKHKGRGTDVI